MRRDTGEFVKTARTGSVYATSSGRYYIRRDGAQWVLLERVGSWVVLGRYGSLAAAVSDFRSSGRSGKDLPGNA